MVGCIALELVAFIPTVIGFATFAVTQLVAHQVVAVLAILVDVLIFFSMVRPTTEDFAKAGLAQMLLKGDTLIASQTGRSALENRPAQAALPSNRL